RHVVATEDVVNHAIGVAEERAALSYRELVIQGSSEVVRLVLAGTSLVQPPVHIWVEVGSGANAHGFGICIVALEAKPLRRPVLITHDAGVMRRVNAVAFH